MRPCVRERELEAAVDGRLDADATRAVLHHAERCARCREAKGAFESLRTLAREMPGVTPDDLRVRRVRGRILGAALMDEAPARTSTRARWSVVAAAAATLALALTAVAWTHRGSRATYATAPSTSRPARRSVDLAGAGTLWPAADTRVLVRAVGRDTRVELWQGEVTLQVNRRAPGERLVVQLTDAEVEVHGTRFTVMAEAGRLTRVDVAEGVVAVRRSGDPERMLTAGAHLLLPTTPEPVTVSEPAPDLAPVPGPALPVVAPPPVARPVDPGPWFREGSFAYARGDHASAERALDRFLAATPRSDTRREDARYLRVLSLHALGRTEALRREGDAYVREFPGGVRRPEVVLAVATSLADDGRCDEALRYGRAMPDDAPVRIRAALTRALRCELDAP